MSFPPESAEQKKRQISDAAAYRIEQQIVDVETADPKDELQRLCQKTRGKREDHNS